MQVELLGGAEVGVGSRLIAASSTAVIKMEGGTDFDLQVLEAPAAPAASGGDVTRTGAGAGAGDRSQEERMGGGRSAPTNPEAKGAQLEEASGVSGAPARDRKDSQRVSADTPPHSSS